jgi:hypothetical protein
MAMDQTLPWPVEESGADRWPTTRVLEGRVNRERPASTALHLRNEHAQDRTPLEVTIPHHFLDGLQGGVGLELEGLSLLDHGRRFLDGCGRQRRCLRCRSFVDPTNNVV